MLNYLEIVKSNCYAIPNKLTYAVTNRIDKKLGKKTIIDHFVTGLGIIPKMLLYDDVISDHNYSRLEIYLGEKLIFVEELNRIFKYLNKTIKSELKKCFNYQDKSIHNSNKKK